jgi:hypothetical protein
VNPVPGAGHAGAVSAVLLALGEQNTEARKFKCPLIETQNYRQQRTVAAAATTTAKRTSPTNATKIGGAYEKQNATFLRREGACPWVTSNDLQQARDMAALRT